MIKVIILVCLLSLVPFAMAEGLTVSVSEITGNPGGTAKVPINLNGASDVGSMEIVLTYDSNVLKATGVEGVDLGKNSFIESNTERNGEVIIGLADSSGINGDGTVAVISFEIPGKEGSTSPLKLEEVSVNNLDLVELVTSKKDGVFRVEKAFPIAYIGVIIVIIVLALIIIKKKKK